MSTALKSASLHGAIQILCSLIWLSKWVRQWFRYLDPDILFYFMYPSWVLVVVMVLGILGSWSGCLTIKKTQHIQKGYFLLLELWTIGLITMEMGAL
ncbi:MAG: hypothetical protein LAT76_06065 [Schleiferiaceae bacterium]|nr:hypothetical protein [Schleiferiaceae bacterium]